jgi:imidazolonepropionase-like amidohydrolase
MPTLFGINLIGFIQMTIGVAIVAFISVKYLNRKKKNKENEYTIQNVHVIVGDGSELFHQNVYIKDGMINDVTDKTLEIKQVQILDGTGKTLMPGLIDSHTHIQGLNNRSDRDSDRFLDEQIPIIFSECVLPYGITTIKDLCAPKHFIYKLRDQIKSGKIIGPELLVVGPNFTSIKGHPANTLGGNNPWIRKEMALEVSTSEQVSVGIDELKAAGVDFLKFTYQGGDYRYFDEKLQINKLDKALMKQIISEGKENGMLTTAHVFYKEDVRELLEAGIYGIEHGIIDEQIEPDDDIIRLWKESGAHFVPTVNAMTYEKEPMRLVNSIHNLKVLYDAGIPIAMGTDNMLEMLGGDVDHKELAYYVEAGLTPMQAIVLATKNSAEHLGVAERKGMVKPGMEADLILLEKNPAENISNMQFIEKVFLKGKIVYSQKPIRFYDIPRYTYHDDVKTISYESPDKKTTRQVDVSGYAAEKQMIQTVTHDGLEWSKEIFTLDTNLSVLEWRYHREQDNTDITAIKENDFINMTGTFKGKRQEKKLKIGDGLWYQQMDLAMPPFIQSSLNEIIFYSIGTGENRGAMGLGEFAAKKIGEEEVSIRDVNYSCVKIKFVLTMFSWACKDITGMTKNRDNWYRAGKAREKIRKFSIRLKHNRIIEQVDMFSRKNLMIRIV